MNKEKLRRLYDLDIEEITLCKFPANKKTFFIKKADSIKQVLAAVSEFLDDDFLVEKEDMPVAQFLKAVEVLGEYKDDMPEDLKQSFDTVLAFAAALARRAEEGAEEEEEEEEEEVKKSEDEYPSVPNIVFELPEDEEEEDGEPAAEDIDIDGDEYLAPIHKRLRRLEGIQKADAVDPWPSLDRIMPSAQRVAVKKEEEEPDPDANMPPVKKSLDGPEGDVKKKKAGDEEDPYPSIPSALFELP